MRIPSFSGVCAAAEAVAKVVPKTPLLRLELHGRTIFVKAESLQPMGAFKLRGGWWRLSNLTEAERANGVVAFSSGNHAQGVAWAAKRLGIAATIAMPSDAPKAKIAGTRELGADIVFYNRQTESREAIAAALAEERGAVLVPSFDDPWVVEGQGSAGIEAAAQMGRQPTMVITPCGGGGLAAGLSLACPDARIVIVEPENWDDMARSLSKGEIVEVAADAPWTACDALQTKRVADLTFSILKDRGATGVVVSEAEIEAAMRHAYDRLRLVVEPGGAVGLAALVAGKVEADDATLLLISGGNVDAGQFARVLAR
ncbi:Phenylserine dehydratase [Sphingomonas antarctica]|uniref:threonine ammonia-lyase n=1 Tax=Sphingomonas antarctica TaxID=2040274 RepID=UPI0039E9F60E